VDKDHKLIIIDHSSLHSVSLNHTLSFLAENNSPNNTLSLPVKSINSKNTLPEEKVGGQIALVIEDNRLTEVSLEDLHTYLDGIYLGKVQNVLSDIQAYFVEIDKGVLCFLRFSEVQAATPILVNRIYNDHLMVGDEVVVQVTADPIKSKQMSVTTNISIKGRYLVLSMGKSQLGISSKIPKKYRNYLKSGLHAMGIIDEKGQTKPIPIADYKTSVGCIVRTEVLSHLITAETGFSEHLATNNIKYSGQVMYADIEHSDCVVTADYNYSDRYMTKDSGRCDRLITANIDSSDHPIFAIIASEYKNLVDRMCQLMQNAKHRTCYSCLQPPPAYYETVIEGLRKGEKWEIVTDLPALYAELEQYLQTHDYQSITARLYQDDILPLAKLYSIDSRLKEALSKKVWLKSGAYLVIEQTEAMTVIDVNTGKAFNKHRQSNKRSSRKHPHDITYFYQINQEAAKEIALQLRLRNLSGITIVDFINMEDEELEQKLLHTFKQLVMHDPIKTDVIDITPLGLVEITRKRKGRPLSELLQSIYPH
jgi:Ribonuclease G/E